MIGGNRIALLQQMQKRDAGERYAAAAAANGILVDDRRHGGVDRPQPVIRCQARSTFRELVLAEIGNRRGIGKLGDMREMAGDPRTRWRQASTTTAQSAIRYDGCGKWHRLGLDADARCAFGAISLLRMAVLQRQPRRRIGGKPPCLDDDDIPNLRCIRCPGRSVGMTRCIASDLADEIGRRRRPATYDMRSVRWIEDIDASHSKKRDRCEGFSACRVAHRRRQKSLLDGVECGNDGSTLRVGSSGLTARPGRTARSAVCLIERIVLFASLELRFRKRRDDRLQFVPPES